MKQFNYCADYIYKKGGGLSSFFFLFFETVPFISCARSKARDRP